MILVDHQTTQAIQHGHITITPHNPKQQQPASYDLRLGPQFTNINPNADVAIDPAEPWDSYSTHETYTWHIIRPHEFVLAHTQETIRLGPTIAAQVEGKSSIARMGLQVHCAGFVDPGFNGQITLELYNMTDHHIVVYPGMLIAQIKFEQLGAKPERLYGDPQLNSKYQNQTGATPTRIDTNQ